MAEADHAYTTFQERARNIVKFWRRRGWLSNSAPIHLHQLDLDKLEELIAEELAKGP
jgi:hypothetical protein